MAITQIDPYYRVGTATFAASTTVTGQGTSWLGNVEPGDQIFNRLGQMAVVASVNSDTSITLVTAFAGTVQTAGAYTIYRVPDSVRLENFSQRSVNLLKGGNVQSLADQTLAADKGIYASGAGTLATFDFSAAMRTLMGSASNTALLVALNLAEKQSSLTDATSGRLMQVGAFGLGGTGSMGGADLNAIAVSQLILGESASPANWDSALLGTYPTGFHLNRSSVIQSQFAIGYGGKAGYRTKISQSAWSNWRRFYDNENILGTVSQSAGVPTGAVIQRGSNANGEFVRFADGTQICTMLGGNMTATSVATGGGFQAGAVDAFPYPATFAVSPCVVASAYYVSGARGWPSVVTAPSTSLVQLIAHSFTSGSIIRPYIIAIGRWF